MIPISSIPANNFTGAAAPLTMRNFQTDLEKTGGLKEAGLSSGATQASGTDPFGTMMKKFVNDVDSKMKVAATENNKVMTGESTNLHQAVLAGQESSVAFSLMVELRNKLVESYQELMRAQV
ncbi:MAG: flagellar hook-basal body complex protein FliE [Verrucomicrobia bacterium]|nr:flagellar hook-basal body complex protein FliE [Verrucomicrobiota bacterium]